MNQPLVKTELRSTFEAVWQHKDQIADELEQMVDQYPTETSRRLRHLVESIRGDLDYEDALMNPEVLTIVLPLLTEPEPFLTSIASTACDSGERATRAETVVADTEVAGNVDTESSSGTGPEKRLEQTDLQEQQSQQIVRAVRDGCNRIALLPSPISLRVFGILCAPLLLAFAVWAIWVIVGRTLIRQSQETFEEFDIEGTGLAQAIFASANLTSEYWYLLIPVPPLVLAFVFYMLLLGQHSGTIQSLGIATFLQGRRNKLARWLWHLSLLLRLRVEQSTAIMIAGHSTPVGWIRNRCLKWSENNNIPILPSRQREFDSDQPPPPPPTHFFGKPKYLLLDYAISLPKSEYKIDLLEEIANYYWERDRMTGIWWIYWLAAIMNLLIFLTVGALIVGLFSLLFQLAYGLF